MKLTDLFDDWLQSIVYEQGVTKSSRKTYASHMRRFFRWLEDEGGYTGAPLEAFSVPVLRRFNYSLGKQGLKPTSIRGVFNGVRSFGNFLTVNGVLPENPVAKITMPKKNAPERTECTDAQVLALMEGCDRIANARRSALARAIVATFAYCGLRRTEALNLKVSDINLSEGSVTVRHGKGDKRRVVPTCPECVLAWREWLAHREQDARYDWLFLENKSRRLWHDGLHVLWEDVRAAAGLRNATDLTPHVIRHNFASRLVRNGADLKSVGTLLGHCSLVVTDRYVHADAAQVRQAAQLASLSQPKPEQTDRPALRVVSARGEERQRRRLTR